VDVQRSYTGKEFHAVGPSTENEVTVTIPACTKTSWYCYGWYLYEQITKLQSCIVATWAGHISCRFV